MRKMRTHATQIVYSFLYSVGITTHQRKIGFGDHFRVRSSYRHLTVRRCYIVDAFPGLVVAHQFRPNGPFCVQLIRK